MKPAALGLVGLGPMGRGLALNAAERGFPVCVWARRPEQAAETCAAAPGLDVRSAATLKELVAALERPRRILLMVPAGSAVDEMIRSVAPLLQPGDVVADGGNSHYADTRRRAAELAARGLEFLGLGVSGGEEGARRGPSLMAGGSAAAFALLRPLLEAIAARSELGACVAHLGPDGAGHFVKMAHNGIEYAELQFLAEACDLLRRGLGLSAADAAAAFEDWNRGELESFLLELAARVLRVRDAETGQPLVDVILDQAEQKGTGRWAVQAALELGVPVPSIAAAVDARVLSSRREERARAAALLAGPSPPAVERPRLDQLAEALLCARICAFAHGMDLIAAASRTYGWNVDRSEVARVWTAGCILRSRLLGPIRAAFLRDPQLPSLLLDPTLGPRAAAAAAGLRAVVRSAAALGLPAAALASALSYLDTVRAARLPLNLTAAQRDAFGRHGFLRADHAERGPQHADWTPAP